MSSRCFHLGLYYLDALMTFIMELYYQGQSKPAHYLLGILASFYYLLQACYIQWFETGRVRPASAAQVLT